MTGKDAASSTFTTIDLTNVTDFAGLEGKRVATVGLSSHNTLTMWELVDRAGDFVKGETMRRSLEPALGRGLLTAEGEHWRWQRRAASREQHLLASLARAVRMSAG